MHSGLNRNWAVATAFLPANDSLRAGAVAMMQMMNRMMYGMSGYGGWMIAGMASFCLLVLFVLVLAASALIKYSDSQASD